MHGLWMVVLMGLFGGAAVGVQAPIAGMMGQKIGGTAGSMVVHCSGFIFSGILLLFRGGEEIAQWRSLSWYMWGAGIFGVILYQTINITLPRLGAVAMLALIIIGQLLAGVAVDALGLFGTIPRPLDLSRIVGMLLLLSGGYLVMR